MAAESVVNVMVTANHLASEMLLLPRMLASFPLTPTKTRLAQIKSVTSTFMFPAFILLKKLHIN
jgi:hypothetical protein